MLRKATAADAPGIASIYNHYVLHTHVTFEEKRVPAKEMARRITTVTEKGPWLIYQEQGEIAGFAYAHAWKARPAYRYSVESTVYVKPGEHGQGMGTRLYTALLNELQARKMHAAIGGIALPNEASIRLHEKLGFKKIGQFNEVGYKFKKWIDVGYWQLIF